MSRIENTAIGLAVLVVVIVTLRALTRREPDPVIRKLIVAGLAAKFIGSALRFTLMADLYDGRGDARRYLHRGADLAVQIRSGTLPEQAKQTGTAFMDFIAGMVFAVLPTQLWIGYVVFAFLSFIGALLFLKAFRLAVPDGNYRRYAVLVFFVPTMVFWPSSMGKDAWLVFSLGIAAYGAARILRRARWGYPIIAVGTAGAFMVRPHMGALFALAFAGAFALRQLDLTVRRGVVGWLFGLMLVGIGAGYTAANFGEELPRDESVEGSATEQVFSETGRRTSQGGSAYESRPVRSIGDLGVALITVPFRPFPTEGHNTQAQLAGIEGLVLLVLVLVSLPGLVSKLSTTLLLRPYVALAAAYSIGFVIAFANVGNFGILTRQRTQLLPFLVVLLALGRSRRREKPVTVLVPTILANRHRHALESGTPMGSASTPIKQTNSPPATDGGTQQDGDVLP